jgi:hypothetical protein
MTHININSNKIIKTLVQMNKWSSSIELSDHHFT